QKKQRCHEAGTFHQVSAFKCDERKRQEYRERPMEEFHRNLVSYREWETPKHLDRHDQTGIREVWLTINAMFQQIKIGDGKVIMQGIKEDLGTQIAHKKNQARQCKEHRSG